MKYGPKNGKKKTEEKILKNPILAVWQNEKDNEAFVYWYIIFFLIIGTYLFIIFFQDFLNFANTWRPFTDGDEALVVVVVDIACLDELFIDGALYTRTILFSSSIGSTELSIKSEGKRLSNWVLADWTVRSSWIISSGELRYINMWI